MILYIEDPKETTRKLLELINWYSKVTGYKINTQKSLALLYTNNEKTERQIKETIPLTIVTKRIKYLGINLLKEREDQDFPGGPVVKTQHFQHRGHEFNPWSGKIPYALWPKKKKGNLLPHWSVSLRILLMGEKGLGSQARLSLGGSAHLATSPEICLLWLLCP